MQEVMLNCPSYVEHICLIYLSAGDVMNVVV